ncbi:MAG TPA: hypothetical protein VLT84_02825 [Acidobacteriota bacterium]|nr:hypothetical protein [Acidobacteriota bacterium]
MHMRKTIVAVAAIGLWFAVAAPPNAAADTALGESMWSLEIGTDLGAGSSDGSIAIRRHMGASSAWRFGIDLDFDKRDGDGVLTDTGSPDEDVELFQENIFYAVSFQWMRFAAVRDNLTATFAIGPVLQRRRQIYGESQDVGLPSFQSYEVRQSSTEYGVDLGLGIEWFFTRRLSLGGQAGIRATTGTADVVQIQRFGNAGTYNKTELNYELDTTGIEASTGRIKLTGYF